jgi:hypothetical protein
MAKAKAKGATLHVTISSTLTKIPQCTNITPPGYSVDKIDTTDLESTVMECDSTIADPQPITATVNFDPADTEHIALHALAEAGSIVACQVKLAASKQYTFNAYVASWQPQGLEVKGIQKVDFSLQPTGAITIATLT